MPGSSSIKLNHFRAFYVVQLPKANNKNYYPGIIFFTHQLSDFPAILLNNSKTSLLRTTWHCFLRSLKLLLRTVENRLKAN